MPALSEMLEEKAIEETKLIVKEIYTRFEMIIELLRKECPKREVPIAAIIIMGGIIGEYMADLLSAEKTDSDTATCFVNAIKNVALQCYPISQSLNSDNIHPDFQQTTKLI